MNKSKKLLGILVVIALLSMTFVACAAPLTLRITSPGWRTEVTENSVTVTGIVSESSAKVAVNGIVVNVARDGSFSTSAELAYGTNTITVTANLEKQKPVTKTVTVTRILAIDIALPQDKAQVVKTW